MKAMKKILSLLLALCMVFGLVPISAFAEEEEAFSAEEEVFQSEDVLLLDEEVEEQEEQEDILLFDDEGVSELSVSGGTSVGQPFPTSVIGSGHYRIPAFVTLNDGTLVAAADARWRTWASSYDDAGDIDTIVSYSKDNGANWTYTFANYIENGRSSSNNFAAATFIDPALATDGNTVYMIADLFPGQGSASQCSSAAQSGTGYDENGYLKLSTDAQATSSSTFGYYLKDGRIYDYATNTDQGYAVNAYFAVTKDGTDCGNLFNYDNTCGFHPLMTSYLYLTTSTDGGATWSEPRILNSQVKTDSNDTYFLNSPGRGIVTGDGTIVFGAYGAKGACLIYSGDNGVTWSRSASCTNTWSNASENEIVELSDGTLRMFIRHTSGDKLQYVDATKNTDGTYSWGSIVTMNITVQDNVNVTAISYSKNTEDGKQVVLVAVATSTDGTYSRKNGKIFTFTVDDSNNMTLENTYEVNGSNDAYSYSCLTEQSDGSIGLLYEKGDSGNITYANYDIATVTNLTFAEDNGDDGENNGSGDNNENNGNEGNLGDSSATNEESYTLSIGGTETVTVDGAYEGEYATDDPTVATVTTKVETTEATEESTDAVSMSSNGEYTGIIGNGTQWMTLNGTTIGYTTDPTQATEFTVTRSGNSYTIKNGEYYIHHSNNSLSASTNSSNATWSFSDSNGFYYTSNSGGPWGGNSTYYLTFSNGWFGSSSWTVSTSKSTATKLYKYSPEVEGKSETTITFTGVAPGETSVTIGDTKYNLTVVPTEKDSNVYLTTNSQTTLNALTVLGWEDNGYTVTYTLTGDCITLSGATVTGNSEGTATVVATVAKDGKTYATVTYTITVSDYITAESPFIGGDTTYQTYGGSSTGTQTLNYVGQDKEITALIITAGSKYDLDIASNYSGTVVWGSTDESVVTVDQNGLVTAVAVPENDTPVYVTATINGKTYAIPVTVLATSVTNSTSYTRTLDMYNNLEYNCTAYYSYRLGALEELPYGAQVFVQQDADQEQDLITFFATPDEGYALTFVQGSDGQFFHTVRDSSTEEGYGYTANSDGNCNDSLGRPSGGHEWLHDQLIGYTYNNSIRLGLSDDEYLEKMHAMLDDAVSKGCDGGFFWSRYVRVSPYSYSMQSDLYFIAEKLPEMSKVLTGVTSDGTYKPYTDGMTVGMGDTLHYTIYVNVPTVHYTQNRIQSELGFTPTKGSPEINYNNYVVSDNLTQAKWLADTLNSESVENDFEYSKGGSSTSTKTVIQTYKSSEANYNAWVASNTPVDGSIHLLNRSSFDYTKKDGTVVTYDASTSNTYAYHTDLTLTEENFSTVVTDGTITNTAKLEHSYSTTYSNGKGTATSTTVVVDIKVETYSYVIDFGLPITIDLTGIVSGATSFEIEGTEAKYGTATISGTTLTYTPNTILQADDFVTFKYTYSGGKTGSTGVRIYPATSVFYEEDFLTYTGSWTKEGNGVTGNQATEVLGSKTFNYGYDDAYKGNSNAGGITDTNNFTGSYKKSTTVGDTASFSFTGTGFQLYANSKSGSGIVTVYRGGQTQKIYMIDTQLSHGDTSATEGQSGSMYYSLPIISETGLDYGNYTVTITHTNSTAPVYIDGVRILGTMSDSTIYAADLEDDPDFYELRDYVLKAIGVENGVSDYGTVKELAGQVYNGNKIGEDSAIVIDVNESSYQNDSNYAQDLLDNGPKNELYLYGGQTLVFKVKTNRVMQIGLKAPTGSTTYGISVIAGENETITNVDGTLNTSVDMFYEIAGKVENATAKEYTVTITARDAKNPLSVTLLKICDDPDAAFTALTQDDIENALMGIYGVSKEETPTEPVDPEEPTNPVEPVDPEEPTNPVEPEEPEQPEEPEEPDTLTTSLTVTYVNLFGKKVGSATLTKEMTDGRWIISAGEIRANAPAGRKAIWLLPVILKAGQQQSIVVPVF